ncbi:MAG TPA: hypothetical protein PKL89_05135 [Coprothermobacter proteolyticus]|uniref:hypothetical protein n=1 Tax=Coprothermobacter proteolyticus TaxID=35786 RepID=UPI000D319825|nr:hypothetical protein [Coprothermobacter proteolyticus]HOA65212.1 hypothetical protein [Coprothermobacter proteolyticus]HOK24713.1 hypothetical protein [Coprothermobacter proteolyticus]HOL53549.1 hypothetical protein [Coprothermobacter proteolyticus]HOP45946.1 hypothetical protein [Coprothermobacter proteolyticus]HPO83118.1 hypothetical protein [Coprothermobacter proteolyticus]
MILGWRNSLYAVLGLIAAIAVLTNPFIANPVGWLVFFVGFGGVCLLVEIIAIVQKKPANWDFLIASAVMFVVGLLAYMNKVSADPYMPIEGSSYAVYAFPAFIASLYLFIVSITKSFFAGI